MIVIYYRLVYIYLKGFFKKTSVLVNFLRRMSVENVHYLNFKRSIQLSTEIDYFFEKGH